MDTERKHLLKRLVALVVLSILVQPLGAAEFSKAGYWEAEGNYYVRRGRVRRFQP